MNAFPQIEISCSEVVGVETLAGVRRVEGVRRIGGALQAWHGGLWRG